LSDVEHAGVLRLFALDRSGDDGLNLILRRAGTESVAKRDLGGTEEAHFQIAIRGDP